MADQGKTEESTDKVQVQVEFVGGLETLFGGTKREKIQVSVKTVGSLISYLAREKLTSSHDKFVHAGALRAGILVLINECDWELEGGTTYQLQPNDRITFISTLHGG